MRTKLAVAGLLASLAFPVSVHAHHSTVAEYDHSLTVEFEAVLERFEWVNPHVWFYYRETLADGSVKRWSVQSHSPGGMRRQILIEYDGSIEFALGLRHKVTVAPHRANSADGLLRSMQFPDGTVFAP